MWISAPTPVTTSTMTAESGSTRSRIGTVIGPAAIHRYRSISTCRAPAGRDESEASTARPTANAATTVPHATVATPRRPHRPPATPFATQPRSGSSGIQTAYVMAYPRRRSTSSTSTVSLARKMFTMIARPITTSAAATTSTKNTSTCPSTPPRSRANVTKVRLTALSINSTDMNTISADRRTSTPTVPSANSTALRLRYSGAGTLSPPSPRRRRPRDGSLRVLRADARGRAGRRDRDRLRPLAQRHRADHPDHEHDGRGLERQRVRAEQRAPDLLHRPVVRPHAAGLRPHRQGGRQQRRGEHGTEGGRGPRGHGRARARRVPGCAQQHDDEDEEDDDGPGVDDDLEHGDELGIQKQVVHGQAQEREQQAERAVHGLARRDDAHAPGDAEHRGDRKQDRLHAFRAPLVSVLRALSRYGGATLPDVDPARTRRGISPAAGPSCR